MRADSGRDQNRHHLPGRRSTSLAELTAEIRELNRILVPKGLRLLPLRYQDQQSAAVPLPSR